MSVFRFVRLMAEGEPILVYGDGSQQRDFTFVDDIARGTIAALKPIGYEVVNLGGDRPAKLSEVLDRIGNSRGSEAGDRPAPSHPADVPPLGRHRQGRRRFWMVASGASGGRAGLVRRMVSREPDLARSVRLAQD